MRIPPNHTDEQYRDIRHPKFTRAQRVVKPEPPQANHAYARPTATNLPNQPPYAVNPADSVTALSHHLPLQWPLAPYPPPQTDQAVDSASDAQNAQADDDPNIAGMFALDSAAHPTHIHTPPPSLARTFNVSTRTAANHLARSHTGNIQIRLQDQHKPLRVSCVATKNLHTNLLLVHDTARQYGGVLFTPDYGYILNFYSPQLPTIVAIAPWCKNFYALHSLSPLSALATQTFRTQPTSSKSNSQRRPNKQRTLPQILRQTAALHLKWYTPPTSIPRLKLIPPPHNTPKPDPTTQSYFHWHVVLNHANLEKLKRMATAKTIPILPTTLRNTPPPITCSTCPTTKQKPHPHKTKDLNYPVGTYISSDTCGPFKPRSQHGNIHFVSYLDAHSLYLIVFLIPDRSYVKQTTPLAFHFIAAHHGRPPAIYHTDNAKEFQSNAMNQLYNLHGIEYRSNTPHQPQENSLAERINQTIVTATRAALHHSQLNETFWEDAMKDVVFKYNITLHDTTNKSPYQLFYNRTPELPRLFAFGQLGTIPNYTKQKSKLEPRADSARFMHNISLTRIVALNLRTNRYAHLRSVDFRPYYHHLDPLYTPSEEPPQALLSSQCSPQPIPSTITPTTSPPPNLQTAQQYPDSKYWCRAHDEELDTLDANNIIEWTPDSQIQPMTKLIPLKMTNRYKRSDEGTVTGHKARCTVRGDRMKPYIHFNPAGTTTYTAERPTIRTIFCLAAAFNLKLEQFDISSAFLHEKYDPTHPVYVSQLPRSNGTYKQNCQSGILRRNLYGTPSTSHIYFEALDSFLTSKGYLQADSDPCLFLCAAPDGPIFISITIDDFLVAAPHTSPIDILYDELRSRYNPRRMGEPKIFLNWRIARLPNSAIHISQPHTISIILEKHELQNCNPKPTPYLDVKNYQSDPQSPLLAPEKAFAFCQTVGELRYITDSTRPDIAHATSRLATVMQHPNERHWGQFRYLLKYLKGTRHHGILYKSIPFSTLTSYADAGFANTTDRRSYSGIVHMLSQSPIMWQSRKQKIVALSTCEAEYLAAYAAAQQAMWLHRLLSDIGKTPEGATNLRLDNNAAILVANQTSPTKHRKYIQLRHHFLQHLVKRGYLSVTHTPSASMLGDMLTKHLKKQPFIRLRNALNITSPPIVKPHQRAGNC